MKSWEIYNDISRLLGRVKIVLAEEIGKVDERFSGRENGMKATAKVISPEDISTAGICPADFPPDGISSKDISTEGISPAEVSPDERYVIIKKLLDGSSEEKMESLEKIESFYSKKDLSYLIYCLDDESAEVRKHTALLLGKLKEREAEEYVAELLEDEDPDVAECASIALMEMDEDFPTKTVQSIYRKGEYFDLYCRAVAHPRGDFEIYLNLFPLKEDIELPDEPLILYGNTGGKRFVSFPVHPLKHIKGFVFTEIPSGNYFISFAKEIIVFTTLSLGIILKQIYFQKKLARAAGEHYKIEIIEVEADRENVKASIRIKNNDLYISFSVSGIDKNNLDLEYNLIDKRNNSTIKVQRMGEDCIIHNIIRLKKLRSRLYGEDFIFNLEEIDDNLIEYIGINLLLKDVEK